MGAKKKRAPGPRPRWPYVPCPEDAVTTAADILSTIVFLAARGGAPNLDAVIAVAIGCAANELSNDDRRRKLIAAYDHARRGDWSAVAEALATNT